MKEWEKWIRKKPKSEFERRLQERISDSPHGIGLKPIGGPEDDPFESNPFEPNTTPSNKPRRISVSK